MENLKKKKKIENEDKDEINLGPVFLSVFVRISYLSLLNNAKRFELEKRRKLAK